MDLAALQRNFGRRIALQGNVDPCVLLSSREAIVHSVQQALRQTNGRGHILNLGHGILPETPVENALAFIRAGQSARLENLSRSPRIGRRRDRGNAPAGATGMSDTMSEPRDSGLNLELDRERFRISPDFLALYNRPGPRYTSYPTAPVWRDDFGPGDLEHAYEQADAAGTPISMYMHLPFCESLCLFCACNVVITKDHSVAPPYLATLEREIAYVAERVSHSRQIVQFHWGGGTPTYLTPEQMEDLFGFTAERFSFAPDAEIGIEIDPRVTSVQHLVTLRRLGFNRLSMGIQDFDPEVQQAVKRVQPLEMTSELIARSRALGFESLNVDLIYGLPYQTADRLCPTVDEVLGLDPTESPCSAMPTCRGPQAARLAGRFPARGHGEISHLLRGHREIPGRGLSIHRHGSLRETE